MEGPVETMTLPASDKSLSNQAVNRHPVISDFPSPSPETQGAIPKHNSKIPQVTSTYSLENLPPP